MLYKSLLCIWPINPTEGECCSPWTAWQLTNFSHLEKHKKKQYFYGCPFFFTVLSRPNVVYKQTYETTRKSDEWLLYFQHEYSLSTRLHVGVCERDSERGERERRQRQRRELREKERGDRGVRERKEEWVGMTERQGRVCVWSEGMERGVWGGG